MTMETDQTETDAARDDDAYVLDRTAIAAIL